MDEGRREDVAPCRHGLNLALKGEPGNLLPLFVSMLFRILTCYLLLVACGTAQADVKRVEVPIGDSPVIGPVDAPVTIIEFIDFQ